MLYYEGKTIRMSCRQFTFGQLLERKSLSGQAAAHYDMRTFISYLKNGWMVGSIKVGFTLSGTGREAMRAFGHTNIERTSTLDIPEYVQNFRTKQRRANG